jgi:hypothetical protein
MSTTFDTVLTSPPSGRATALIIDHTAYGTAVLLRGAPVPWSEPAACASYFGQAQGLLRPDTTLVDVGAAYSQHLANRPDLVEAMGARSRTGYALKTLLADDGLADAVVKLVAVLSETSRQPLVLHVPSPLRWLAQAGLDAGGTLGKIEADHGEQASMYLSDWLRRFSSLPVALVLLDGRRDNDPALAGLPPDDLAAYTPIVNATEHYRWGLGLGTEDQVVVHGSAAVGAVVPPDFWTGSADAPIGDFRFTIVPADVRPEHVLDRLQDLT